MSKLKDLEELIEEIEKGKKSESGEATTLEAEVENYLELIRFMMTDNYSFCQISRLGAHLQEMDSKKKLSWMHVHNFDTEELSYIATQCF